MAAMNPPDDAEQQESQSAEPSGKKAQPSRRRRHSAFPVVGIGASAGGLDALTEFFSNLPEDPGMAFVVVSHLTRGFESRMPELLQRAAHMPAVEVTDGMDIQRDHIYVIPPGKSMVVQNGMLRIPDNTQHPGALHTIDVFLRSLAADRKKWAIAVILSGTGTDGTLGIRDIKANLGMVMVQDPQTAQHQGMPQSAIATGTADYVLAPRDMPRELKAYVEGTTILPSAESSSDEGAMAEVFSQLRRRTGHDFSGYKRSTIDRRIQRRLRVNQAENLADYVKMLRERPGEVDILFKELLITVTSFFRDAEAWQALAEELRRYLRENVTDRPIRAWVAGCATGEEAYTLAIVLHELARDLELSSSIQVFATDADAEAIDVGRAGVYLSSIATDVDERRLSRFFTVEDDQYRVSKSLREAVIFAKHDLTRDPPFSKLDLVCCRNLLIYLTSAVQKSIIPLFHYAIRNSGILFLGSSETIGATTDLFRPANSRWRIYRRILVPTPVQGIPHGERAARLIPDMVVSEQPPEYIGTGDSAISEAAATSLRELATLYAPPAVTVDDKFNVLHVQGRTGRYLELPSGDMRANVLDMARPGLAAELSLTLQQASALATEVTRRGINVRTNGGSQRIDLQVRPLAVPGVTRRAFLIMFHDVADESVEGPEASTAEDPGDHRNRRIAELQDEVDRMRESLQATYEEYQSSMEELQSANEEYQSTNEELQSANEELESSREELQSVNEELNTVNTELETNLGQLTTVNDDMTNLLNSTDIATIFVDTKLNIKRFTPAATRIFNLMERDVDRPLSHITSRLECDGLAEEAKGVLRTLQVSQREVCASDGRWFSLRMLPYRTTDDSIAGLVITFVDVDEQKKNVEQLEQAFEYIHAIVHTVGMPLAVTDKDRKIVSTNDSFRTAFGLTEKEAIGASIHIIADGGGKPLAPLDLVLENALNAGDTVERCEVRGRFKGVGQARLRINAHRVRDPYGITQTVLLGAPPPLASSGAPSTDGSPDGVLLAMEILDAETPPAGDEA